MLYMSWIIDSRTIDLRHLSFIQFVKFTISEFGHEMENMKSFQINAISICDVKTVIS